ncbi:ABC transporter permease [Corynebacterium lowii]|uniref:Sulfate/thiosulfate transporter subunit n=1 Tax=Corynebacterium lowii TaxID=1544413 RepID=A0A0Q0YXL4_9CORY|nr:iron ABC transporter permease [Corynebacterium lowii]KQB87103.1 sulfate/thiosulfate transporter subunit [Corynebacterium lowii]MDP9852311.1 iron(III) transport system permease protein [Corynebacterium lowii]
MKLASIRAMLRSPLNIILLVVVAWFLVTFMILPNFTLLSSVFRPSGSWSLNAFPRLFESERAMKSLRNSFLLAITLSITVNIIGVFIVLVTRYFDIKGARILFLGFATVLLYGGVVMVAGFNFIYGPHGFLTGAMKGLFPQMDTEWFTGFLAVTIVMTINGTGMHLLFLTNSLNKIDYQTIEAARQLGAGSWEILRKIVLPLLRPMLFSITILTFLSGLGAMAAPLMIGGKDFQTITPMILSFSQTSQSRDLAATLALFLGIATIFVLFILNRIERGGTYFSISKVSVKLPKQKISNPIFNVAVHTAAYALFLIYVIPPILIVLFSFTDAATIASGKLQLSSFTLQNYHQILTDPTAYRPFLISVGYSGAAAIITVSIILFVARIIQRYRNFFTICLEYLLHLPWILPSTMIALSLVLTFSTPRALILNQVLIGTVILLGIGYIIEKIPFTLRMLKASFSSIPDNVEEAASILGAKDFRIFRTVLLPAVAPTATAIAALNFNSLLDNYDTAVFLSHPLFQPLGIIIESASRGENMSDSTAIVFVYTVLLMAISGLILYLVYGRSATRRRTKKTSAYRLRLQEMLNA